MAQTVSDSRKQAMQHGRKLSAAVDGYLKAIGQPKRRGRRVSVEELTQRRAKVLDEADRAVGVARLKLVQQAADLEQRITQAAAAESVDLDALEARFVEVAAEYGDIQGINYATWREVGVPADVLKRAGIKQTRRRK